MSARPIATFDLSSQCPLRCRHCYFYATGVPAELGDDQVLERLVELRDSLGIRSAFWVGGEPLLRAELLLRAMRLFPRNALATSAQVPVPGGLPAGVLVSLDGREAHHDALRGAGSYRRALTNTAHLAAKSFAVLTTLCAENLDAVDELPQLVEETRALGVLVGFFVGHEGSFSLSAEARERALDRLHRLQARQPGVVLNPPASLELFRAAAQRRWSDCIYRHRAIAFGPDLLPKTPCTYGPEAQCGGCGCPVVAMHLAADAGDDASRQLLRALFVPRDPAEHPRLPPTADRARLDASA